MKRATYSILPLLMFVLLSMLSYAESSEKNIVSRTAEIDGQQMHYLYAGHGPAVLLLHGFAETSRRWRPLIPLLAEKFTVIAPDLPGIGDSSIPTDKIDMINFSESDPRACAFARDREGESCRSRYWTDGSVRVCHAVPGGNGEAGGDGCVSSRCRRMGADLQCAKYLAFPFQRRISRKVGAGARAHLFRLFLERLGSGQNALHSRIGSK